MRRCKNNERTFDFALGFYQIPSVRLLIVAMLLRRFSLLVSCCLVFGLSVHAQEYTIDTLKFEYGNPRSGLPDLDALQAVTVDLVSTGEAWTAAGKGTAGPVSSLPIGSIGPDARLTGDAVNAVMAAVVRYFNQQDLMAVYAVPAEGQVNPRSGRDLRRDTEDFVITVWIGRVDEVRSVARGDRFSERDAINVRDHSRILANAPIGAGASDLLRDSELDEYLARLNRHGGRRVDLAVSASGEPGGIVADFLVNERKPWVVYVQASNTGTASTGEFRARTGFIHFQLTDADDTLAVEYVSDFQDTQAAMISYARPLSFPNYWVARVYGAWSEFTARDLGILEDLVFEGTTTTGGIEIIYSPFRFRGFAFDFAVGVETQILDVNSFFGDSTPDDGIDDKTTNASGQGTLLMPFIRASIERRTAENALSASIGFRMNTSTIDATELVGLGRTDAAEDFMLLTATFNGSLFLETLFRDEAEMVADWRSGRLAHELRFRFSGQFGFDKRVVAQQAFTVGGMDRVRGYPESVSAGDTGFNTSLEYAFHLPRALKPISALRVDAEKAGTAFQVPDPIFGRFQLRPRTPGAIPDWDLILKAFVDAGFIENNGNDVFKSYSLLSAGVGVDLQLASYISIRADWGYVLGSLETGATGGGFVEGGETGDSRIHLRAQVTW